MKKPLAIMQHTLAIMGMLSTCVAWGQDGDMWTAFKDDSTELIGFKDSQGTVTLEPKFMGLTTAGKFADIMAVTEEVNGRQISYYLTRLGRVVARDSLHIHDNSPDCENEGFIRFRDPETDQVGILNKTGDIIVPAAYSELTKVTNGMIAALKGAEKEYEPGGEHYRWVGGQELLIDTNNQVLVTDFNYRGSLDFHSLEITPKPGADTIRRSFKATDGSYYSFIDFEREFRSWFHHTLLANITEEVLLQAAFDTLVWSPSQSKWQKISKRDFIIRHFEVLKTKLAEVAQPDCDYFISQQSLNPFLFDSPVFANYYNNCGEAREWQYPVMNIVINQEDDSGGYQDQFSFLRTAEEYRLISMALDIGKTAE